MRLRDILFLGVLFFSCALVLGGAPSAFAYGGAARVPIDYLGTDDAVRRALFLTDLLAPAAEQGTAPVIVLNDAPLSPQEAAAIGQEVRRGRSLLLLLGPRAGVETLREIADGDLTARLVTAPQSLRLVDASAGPLAEINWLSAPQARARSVVEGFALQPVVETEKGQTILGRARLGAGTLWVMTLWLGDDGNAPFREWPYFNYLIYSLAAQAAGADVRPFADYPASPVPHRNERIAIVTLLSLMFLGTAVAFALVRRYSLAHPEALERIIADAARFRRREAAEWEEVGFHRPLAGFLFLLAVGLVLFVVLMVYQQIVLYGILLPSAQARGIWSLIVSFFSTFWLLFDWGTSTAFVKFFAQHRVEDPRRGLQYGQLYVWWQALTGTLQLGAVALVAAFVLPYTGSAFMSYFVILHALVQFPGFLRVFQFVFRAYQRQDYDQALNLVLSLAPVLLQSLAVLWLSRWGARHPTFGPMMGGVFGLAVGAYLTEVSAFLIGYWLLKRLGYNAGVLFMAHFDRQTVVSALKFGFPVMLAGVAGGVGFTAQATLTARLILNWTEVQGNWDVVGPTGLMLAFGVISGLFYGLMPAISEAFSHGRWALTRYYIAQGFKYGGFIGAFVASILLGVGDRFILGALGPDYARAVQFLSVVAPLGALQFPAWFSDRLQEGAGKPHLMMWMLIMEQALRIALMLVLAPRLGVWGLIAAFGAALSVKCVVAWWVNGRLILPFRVHWWQTAVSPALAAAVNYALLRGLGSAIWSPNQAMSVVLFLAAMLPSLPLFCFCNALFGGWDDEGLEELRRATDMSGLGKPIAWLIYKASTWGARWSPLHGRFPIPRAEAQAEARALTAAKVALA
jgi:O-antigen/teichoic acid export membrane protein